MGRRVGNKAERRREQRKKRKRVEEEGKDKLVNLRDVSMEVEESYTELIGR